LFISGRRLPSHQGVCYGRASLVGAVQAALRMSPPRQYLF